MAETPFLSDDFLRQLTAAGGTDILVGIPTSNNRDTIEKITQEIRSGLAKYWPREKAALLNADAGSNDGTQAAFKAACESAVSPASLRSTTFLTAQHFHNSGQSGALRLVLTAADLLRARACVFISPDVISISPEWIHALLQPVYRDGFEFVAPVYQRRAFEGLLVRNLISPVIRAAFGYRIAEPAAGDMAISGSAACQLLAKDVWREDMLRHGMNTWMTAAALASGFRTCQAFLGPKVTAAGRTEHDLVHAIKHGVGALFGALESLERTWPDIAGSKSVPEFGDPPENNWKPVHVNRKRQFEMFRKGITELAEILQQIIAPDTWRAIVKVAAGPETDCHFSDELWANTIYEFAGAFRRKVMNRDHLLQALAPVYRGRISSYLLENADADWEVLKARNEELQLTFERLKPRLIEAWRGRS